MFGILKSKLSRFVHRVYKKANPVHLKFLRYISKKYPIPLSYCLMWHRIAKSIEHTEDPLFPPIQARRSVGASLPVPQLRELMYHDELGNSSLDASIIIFLWDKLHRDRPKNILECGSGLSTLFLAKYAEKSGNARVLSLEQNQKFKQDIENRLARAGLAKYAQVSSAPITEEGRYQVDINGLQEWLRMEKVDWVLIDGPFGPKGCRKWTLPLLSEFCRPGARWFLDDAFRDGELEALKVWANLPEIAVNGIFPIGKGLGAGVVKSPKRS